MWVVVCVLSKHNQAISMKHAFDGIIMLFVGITIAVVMVANVVLPQIFGVDNSTWDSGTRAL